MEPFSLIFSPKKLPLEQHEIDEPELVLRKKIQIEK